MNEPAPAANGRRRALLTAATVVLVVAAAGVAVAVDRNGAPDARAAPTPASRLTSPMTDPAGVSLSHTRAGRPYTLGGLVVCVQGTSAVKVQKVSLGAAEGGLRATAFGVRPQQQTMLGSAQRKVGSIHGFSREPVEARCRDHTYYELAVTVVKPSTRTARARTLEVTYRSTGGGRTGHIRLPFAVGLCAGDSAVEENCASLVG